MAHKLEDKSPKPYKGHVESLNKVIALTTQNKLALVEAQHDVYDAARFCVGHYGVSGLRHIPDLTA